jgi:hypothetical protein
MAESFEINDYSRGQALLKRMGQAHITSDRPIK